MNRLPMSVSICRTNSNMEKDYVSIEIKDSLSSSSFLKLKMSMEEFGLMMTGLSCCQAEGEVRNISNIGKKMEHTTLLVTLDKDPGFDKRKEVATKAAKEQCPEGWILSDTFNSRNSFFEKDDIRYARATIRRWVEPTQQDIDDEKRER